jgi:hypothetical protein
MQLLGPNPSRVAIIFNPPGVNRELFQSSPAVADNAAIDSTGVKLTYTAPSTRRAVALSAGVVINSGSPTIQLRATIGGTTVLLDVTTASTIDTILLHLDPGDSVDWRVETAAAGGSTADFWISAADQQTQDRYTISLGGPAILDQGLTVHPGGPYLMLDQQEFG